MKAIALVDFAVWGLGLLSLAALAFAIWAFFKHGRSTSRSSRASTSERTRGPTFRRRSSARCSASARCEDSDIAATLMNLADKGIISMQPVVETTAGLFGAKEINTYELSMAPEARPELTGLDANLTHMLFSEIGEGGPVRLEDIKAYAKDNAKAFSESIQQWKDNATAQADQLGLMESASGGWQVGLFVLATAVVAIGWVASFASQVYLGLVLPMICGAVIAVLASSCLIARGRAPSSTRSTSRCATSSRTSRA